MKRSRTGYIVLISFTLAVLCAVFAGSVFAKGDFGEAVLQIGEADTWGERSALIEEAENIYASLSDDEKLTFADAYASLVAHKSDLAAIKAKADRFIFFVGTLGDLSDLNEKEEAVALAKGEGVYFDDESYPGISDALAELRTFEEQVSLAVDACIAFINAADAASLIEEDDYLALRAALDEAEKYLKLIDNTYDGVKGAKTSYELLAGEVRVKEIYTEEFLGEVERLKTKTEYKTYLADYTTAKSYLADERFLSEYPGVEDAMLVLSDADLYLKDCLNRANVFITAVSRFGSSEDIAKDLINAYLALEGVDMTVNGVSTAKSVFDSTLKTYNDIAEAIIRDLEIL